MPTCLQERYPCRRLAVDTPGLEGDSEAELNANGDANIVEEREEDSQKTADDLEADANELKKEGSERDRVRTIEKRVRAGS